MCRFALILHLKYLLSPYRLEECCRYAICLVIVKLGKETKICHTLLSNSRLMLVNENENTVLQLIQLYLIKYIKIHFLDLFNSRVF